ncbi:MAG TPA: N-acetylglucosamine-6-phosphate deacetylase [Stellaceae bacterium]|nr:N-acetylglucosamine-6-phosphate deacetylase [Stellaceae bacterium]
MSGWRHAVAADTVFDGAAVHRDMAVVIESDRIAALLPRRDVPAGVPVRDVPAGIWLAPGFIDIQVNGGGDVLFNDTPSPEGIAAIAAAHRRFGTTALLPTLISAAPETMRAAGAAAAALVGVHPGILGIHYEGPFLSPDRPGVHDPAAIRRPGPGDFALLTSLRRGVTVVTLAPEQAGTGFVAALAGAGVKVSLGHSAANYDETRAALAAGLTGFTHLFNAMPPLLSRAPGPIAAALEEPGAYYGLIADGVHVAPAMLRLALRGLGQAMLVTDAMPPVGGAASEFIVCGKRVAVQDGRCTTADGTLAGSALDMAGAVRNCVRLLGLSLPAALHLAGAAPARFLGLADRLGRLAPGYRADMVALDPVEIRVLASWVAGEADED